MANSVATKNPFANTRPASPASRQMMPMSESGFAVAKKMRVDEVVDDGLVGGIDFLELHPHADPSIAPGHAPLGVDVPLAARHTKTHLDFGSALQRARQIGR